MIGSLVRLWTCHPSAVVHLRERSPSWCGRTGRGRSWCARDRSPARAAARAGWCRGPNSQRRTARPTAGHLPAPPPTSTWELDMTFYLVYSSGCTLIFFTPFQPCTLLDSSYCYKTTQNKNHYYIQEVRSCIEVLSGNHKCYCKQPKTYPRFIVGL